MFTAINEICEECITRELFGYKTVGGDFMKRLAVSAFRSDIVPSSPVSYSLV